MIKLFTASQSTLAKINREIAPALIKERETGMWKDGKKEVLSYISGSTVIDLLNEVFGTFGWSFEVIDAWIEKSTPHFQKENDKKPFAAGAAIQENELGVKGVTVKQNDICHVKGRLTIFYKDGNDTRTIIKEAFGSKVIVGKASEQEHIFKSAQTDAMKKAASLLGIGAQLYRKPEEHAHYRNTSNRIVWTDALKANYPQHWRYLNSMMEIYNWSYDDIKYWVEVATNGLYSDILYMPEDYIDDLVITFKNDNELQQPEVSEVK